MFSIKSPPLSLFLPILSEMKIYFNREFSFSLHRFNIAYGTLSHSIELLPFFIFFSYLKNTSEAVFYGYIIGAFGTSGKPRSIQPIKNIDHVIKKKIEYGNIIEINVPTPISFTYLFANAIITAKYVINGVMIFVLESAIL